MKSSKYLENLTKLIPVEIVGAFVLLRNSVPQDTPSITIWILFIILAIINPLYIRFAMKVKKTPQILLMAIAFPIWIMCIGGIPISTLEWFKAWMGTIALILFTLIPPMFYKLGDPQVRTAMIGALGIVNPSRPKIITKSKRLATVNQLMAVNEIINFAKDNEIELDSVDVEDVLYGIDAGKGDYLSRDNLLSAIRDIRDIKTMEYQAQSWREI